MCQSGASSPARSSSQLRPGARKSAGPPVRPALSGVVRRTAAPAGVAVSGTGGGGDSGWPAAGRWPGTPPERRSAAPTGRSPPRQRRRSSRLALPGRAVGGELTQRRGGSSLDLDHLAGFVRLAPDRSRSTPACHAEARALDAPRRAAGRGTARVPSGRRPWHDRWSQGVPTAWVVLW